MRQMTELLPTVRLVPMSQNLKSLQDTFGRVLYLDLLKMSHHRLRKPIVNKSTYTLLLALKNFLTFDSLAKNEYINLKQQTKVHL